MSLRSGQPPRRPPARAPLAGWRASYWVALAVMAVGLLAMVWSPFAGGAFYDRAVTPFVELLGAPEERGFLNAQDPEAGTELMMLLGGCYFAVGVCMFCVLIVLELLGLGGAPALTGGMSPRGRLVLGTAAAGVVVFAIGDLPAFLLSLLFVDHEYAVWRAVRALDVVSQAGGLLMLCAAITHLLGGDRLHGPLLRWTEVAGWGGVRRGWVNRLALALIAGGLIGMVRFVPFGDVAGSFFTIGLTVLALGIVPHLLAIARP